MTEELTTTLKILPRLIYESPKHFHENVQRRPPIRGANIINQIYDDRLAKPRARFTQMAFCEKPVNRDRHL